MNARVCLLVLVTAAFMAIWDADRPADNAAASNSASATVTNDAAIPLPKNLPPGTWQAIGRDGNTFRITIERNGSLSCSMFTNALWSDDHGEKLCVITSPVGIHWCFIKESPKTAQQPGSVQQ